ncbi:vacuolar protein sorting-associated protein 26C-like [Pollicipes pollicipes]|uniref:vacuolar protein sorting-associated protein 26C-like n=1 Tax=Pollicipes pollicipes TaxID=41117 RepID=UPI0018857030|nr:vacuolar protein sorting-associated protein 26C-like [Pollicipes pollicipes]
MVSVELRLQRASKVYREGELLCGVAALTARTELRHEGVSLCVQGDVQLTHSGKSAGLVDSFYATPKSLRLLHETLELAPPGRLPAGRTEVPFEVALAARHGRPLHETYHGLYVSVQYTVACEVRRGVLTRDARAQLEFMVEARRGAAPPAAERPLQFLVSPSSLTRADAAAAPPPRFRLRGRLDSTECALGEPLRGELVLESSEAPVRSIELQLVRAEACGRADALSRQCSEVQNIQIGLGDVPRGLAIPIHMVFPRLFTCASVSAAHFQIDFSVNVVVVFKDDHLVSENFPLKLTRY